MGIPGQRTGWRRVLARAALLILLATPAAAQGTAPAETPPKVNELIQLLRDPAVQAWLQQAQKAPAPVADAAPESTTGFLAQRQTEIRQHIQTMIATVPLLPAAFARAGEILAADAYRGGLARFLVLLASFIGLGCAAEWGFRRATQSLHDWVARQPSGTFQRRLRALMIRFMRGIGAVLCLGIGSIGVFLAFEWPPLLQKVVLAFLVATVVLRLTLALLRFLLAPDLSALRVIPMTDDSARFWLKRWGWFIGWLVFSVALLDLLSLALGFTREERQVFAYMLGLGLVAIMCEAAWRRPMKVTEASDGALTSRGRHYAVATLVSVYAVLLWALWATSAIRAFWLLLFIVALPLTLRIARRSLANVLRPGTSAEGAPELAPVFAVGIARAVNAALIIGAVFLLAYLTRVDLMALTAQDTMATRLARGLLNAVVIILIADLAWHVMKALIDRRMSESQETGLPATDEARRRQRIRTLLPIVRNMLFIVMIVITVLMVLAAMGVEIGPLVAGAGVVGVAVGFGAQTLVRDVISGMFYLLDDAFRIGEYIQSGNYKGTVESFSLRSVKLRHHRGPLYTVPFGQLGAVQNMSRDWVIDKMMVSVTYDSDLAVAKKLIKKIGTDLAADPEFAPDIIAPLKMQGIDQFGDFAIEIRMKMTTKPGQQFTIRRRALAMIKQAFDANGIKFAVPTVQVSGGNAEAAVAAQQAMAAMKREDAAQ